MKQLHSKLPGLIQRDHLIVMGVNTQLSSIFADAFSAPPAYSLSENTSNCESDDDVIHFLDEDQQDIAQKTEVHPWKILITDDDVNVHETTLLALTGVRIHGRPLHFLHAYSAKEARQILEKENDIALLLLDVVMETVDAGLKLVEAIRGELNRTSLKIVLRTGQPGNAPEQTVHHQFAIDGYTTKSKLTRSLLISVLNEALNTGDEASGRLN
ncbi:MAG: response regulator [Undibacterium curvum]